MDNQKKLENYLQALLIEHRGLDDVTSQLLEHGSTNQLQTQRLKKRKLVLKDQIRNIEGRLLPDIIA